MGKVAIRNEITQTVYTLKTCVNQKIVMGFVIVTYMVKFHIRINLNVILKYLKMCMRYSQDI